MRSGLEKDGALRQDDLEPANGAVEARYDLADILTTRMSPLEGLPVSRNGGTGLAGRFEVKKTANGEFMFNLKAGNGEVILTSETYKAKASCLAGVESVRKNAAIEGRFDRRQSKTGKPYFALKASNGQDIGRSEMYESEAACENGIKSVMKSAPGANLVEVATG